MKAIGFMLENSPIGLAKKAWGWVSGGRKGKATGGACSLCFTAATVVWTASGQVPIVDLEIGEEVLTLDEATGGLSFQPVTAKVEIPGSAITELTVRYGDRTEVIETTDEHPFWTEQHGWRRVDALTAGDTLHTLTGPAVVERIAYTARQTTVYNFSVAGNPNYFVSEDGVWVHNCRFDAVSDYWTPIRGWARAPRSLVRVSEKGKVVEKCVSKEVHHIKGRGGPDPNSPENLMEVWPWEHEMIDRSRNTGYKVLDILQFDYPVPIP